MGPWYVWRVARGVGGRLVLSTYLVVTVDDFTRGGSFDCGFCKRVHASLCCGDHTGRRAMSKLFCVCPGSRMFSDGNESLGTATGNDFCALCAHLKLSMGKPGLKHTVASTGMRTSFHNSNASCSAVHLHRTCLGLS